MRFGWRGSRFGLVGSRPLFVSMIPISLSHKIQYSIIHENTSVLYQNKIWLIISKLPYIHLYFSSLFNSYTVFEGDIPHFEKITPCVSHSHVSLIPMYLWFPCPSHSHVSSISTSFSFPCLSHSHIFLTIPLVKKVLLTSGASGIGTHVKAQIDSTHIGSLKC